LQQKKKTAYKTNERRKTAYMKDWEKSSCLCKK